MESPRNSNYQNVHLGNLRNAFFNYTRDTFLGNDSPQGGNGGGSSVVRESELSQDGPPPMADASLDTYIHSLPKWTFNPDLGRNWIPRYDPSQFAPVFRAGLFPNWSNQRRRQQVVRANDPETQRRCRGGHHSGQLSPPSPHPGAGAPARSVHGNTWSGSARRRAGRARVHHLIYLNVDVCINYSDRYSSGRLKLGWGWEARGGYQGGVGDQLGDRVTTGVPGVVCLPTLMEPLALATVTPQLITVTNAFKGLQTLSTFMSFNTFRVVIDIRPEWSHRSSH